MNGGPNGPKFLQQNDYQNKNPFQIAQDAKSMKPEQQYHPFRRSLVEKSNNKPEYLNNHNRLSYHMAAEKRRQEVRTTALDDISSSILNGTRQSLPSQFQPQSMPQSLNSAHQSLMKSCSPSVLKKVDSVKLFGIISEQERTCNISQVNSSGENSYRASQAASN